MSRSAVFKLLSTDPELSEDFGLDVDHVFTAHAIDGSPHGDYFLVLRWEEEPIRSKTRTVRVLTIWAHRARASTLDFDPLDRILRRIIELMTTTTHFVGDDGGVMSQARFTGSGSDQYDQGYDTICRQAAFEVLTKEQ